MDETLLVPSPNWFLASILAVSPDEWLVYGGPNKSLCVLEPLPDDSGFIRGGAKYRAHVTAKAHSEKIVTVAISPAWSEKCSFLSGSADGEVKQWSLQREGGVVVTCTQSHEIHKQANEDVLGVGYSCEKVAITVGALGNIVKWELNSNTVKSYRHIMRGLRPTCMACSPHLRLHVAVGTKQGVLLLLDLTGAGRVVYKIRGYDEEILNVSWCPQFETVGKIALSESEKQTSKTKSVQKINSDNKETENVLNQSGTVKHLPHDSFDEPIVQEDNIFDIYKDHEPDEFGHKKYEPETAYVTVKEKKTESNDFLAECLKLKEEILKRKNEDEKSVTSLVKALEETHVNSEESSTPSTVEADSDSGEANCPAESGEHSQKHLLATVAKFAGVRVWSGAGATLGAWRAGACSALLWLAPGALLLGDARGRLHARDPFAPRAPRALPAHARAVSCLARGARCAWSVAQDRRLLRVCARALRVTRELASAGAALYDVQACPYDAARLAVAAGDGAVRVWHADVAARPGAGAGDGDCALDPDAGHGESALDTGTGDGYCALSSSTRDGECPLGTGDGDGECSLGTGAGDGECSLGAGAVQTVWRGVQGKVLTVAWHPTVENLLAFATAEARVGVIEHGKARALAGSPGGAVYSLCWAEDRRLYAAGNGQLVRYDDTHADRPGVPVPLAGGLRASVVRHRAGAGLLLGARSGAVLLLRDGAVRAEAHPHTKVVHAAEWHPEQTSDSSERSEYRNVLATCAADKDGRIELLRYEETPETASLTRWKTLSGHGGVVCTLSWSPHRDARLLSASLDHSARVWDAARGECLWAAGAGAAVLAAAWLAAPALAHAALTAAADGSLRLWDVRARPPRPARAPAPARRRPRAPAPAPAPRPAPGPGVAAPAAEPRGKAARRFLLPLTHRQLGAGGAGALRRALRRHARGAGRQPDARLGRDADDEPDARCADLFGDADELNGLLDREMGAHAAAGRWAGGAVLEAWRGRVAALLERAAAEDRLCPFLLSLAPTVSYKYWKDASQLYLEQIDRLVARGEEDKLCESSSFGGPAYRKALVLLSLQRAGDAALALAQDKLYKEAYVLCRVRYLDGLALDVLRRWAAELGSCGATHTAALCYVALGELAAAAEALGASRSAEELALGALAAELAGRGQLAAALAARERLARLPPAPPSPPAPPALPTRAELIAAAVAREAQ